MESLCAWLIEKFVRTLWWDDLSATISQQGLPVTICSFVGRAVILGALVGGGIALLLGKADAELMDFAVNGICALGALALFVVIATLYIDPDSMI
jgi:hypothetical protein